MNDLMMILRDKLCPNCGDYDFGLHVTGNKEKTIIYLFCLNCEFKTEWLEEERSFYSVA